MGVKDVEQGDVRPRGERYTWDKPMFHNYDVTRDAYHDYDMTVLRNYGWMMLWKRSPLSNMYALVAICLSVTGLTALALTACDDPVIDLGFCVSLSATPNWFAFSTLTSILLSLFLNSVFFRWWQMRDKLQSVIAALLSAAVKIRSVARAHGKLPSNELIARYFCLAYALALKMFRDEELHEGPPLTEVLLPDGTPLVSDEEWAELQVAGRSTFAVVLGWIWQMINGEVKLVGGATGAAYITVGMHFEVQDMQRAIHGIHIYLVDQIPYTYVQFLVLLARVHITFVHLYCAALIGQAITKKDGVVHASWELLLQAYAIMILNFLLYNGILILAGTLERPFGDDMSHFPVQKMWVDTVNAMFSTFNARSLFLALHDSQDVHTSKSVQATSKWETKLGVQESAASKAVSTTKGQRSGRCVVDQRQGAVRRR